MNHTLPFHVDGSCREEACIRGDWYRFTLLTEHILRMEYDPEGIFEDRPSQTVICRKLPAPEFTAHDDGEKLEIDTKNYHLVYYYSTEKKFNANNLVIDAKNNLTNYGARWHFGTKSFGDPPRHNNLFGTARTLDKADGAVELEQGLMDRGGRSFFDDSETAVWDENGVFHARRPGTQDVYYVCCQSDYTETLRDFYRITGSPPMLPRYALGNWWSRWYPYTDESYLSLFDRFQKEDYPFSMAVLDMDWHVTEVDPKYGKGWTGFTWDKKKFPDPKKFGDKLHAKGAHLSLNLHPADGVQGYEDAYEAMAKATGTDTAAEQPVLFDMTSPTFTKAYFEHLMHPLERDGVDHWWIDWQQGRKCSVPGMDPLWLLNHHHFVDNCRDGKRGLILSRYCGLGGHRYPAGFSGDTVVSWKSLSFQAYFTATATNAGFCFWSHDIGGFMFGVRDPELFVRWLQLGVFSSFNRLHSHKNEFASKEPWNYHPNYQNTIGKWLRLRHRLIPYLYSETYRQHTELTPVIRPMYYDYPAENRAYSQRTQYLFGSSLMVCPITSPADPSTGMGSTKAWIPEGTWTDFFTGKTYRGHRVAVLNRSAELAPVLAKAGAIIPTAVLEKGKNDTSNPEVLEVFVFPGADGEYSLFEDDGVSNGYETGKAVFTDFTYKEAEGTFTIRVKGDTSLIPEARSYRITFRGFAPLQVKGGDRVTYDPETRSTTVTLSSLCGDLKLSPAEIAEISPVDRAREFLRFAQIDITVKQKIMDALDKGLEPQVVLEELRADKRDARTIEVLTEILS
ncbi:MAG: DUF5110 domain-containing protein [Ruminococcaceae bacterium]|nr:DUF5110 domain-containing protein [Oscillospiraceae bacterium]